VRVGRDRRPEGAKAFQRPGDGPFFQVRAKGAVMTG
jgi:hypothetical protein